MSTTSSFSSQEGLGRVPPDSSQEQHTDQPEIVEGHSGSFLRIGIYIFGAGSIAAGVINLCWGEFEPAHQPIQAWGDHIPGLRTLAYIAALWLIGGGATMLWRRSSEVGAAALTVLYGIFVLFPIPRLYTAPHFMGQRADIYIGVLASICQLLILFVAGVVAWWALSGEVPLSRTAAAFPRFAFGISSGIFGFAHFSSVETVASMIPKWMPLNGDFWALLTGIAFVLAGLAIISGVLDVLAAKLLGLMLLIFNFVILLPNIVSATHNHAVWGGNAYNLTAVGAAWIVAGWLAARKPLTLKREDQRLQSR